MLRMWLFPALGNNVINTLPNQIKQMCVSKTDRSRVLQAGIFFEKLKSSFGDVKKLKH